MSTPDVNPYEPASASSDAAPRRARWVRPIVILNLILVAIPASAIAFAYIALETEMRREAGGNPDGPIVYETEFVGFSGPAWPMYMYFVAPNVMLLAFLAKRARSLSAARRR